MLTKEDIKELIKVCHQTIVEHADELTTLDSAIGDGDHGHNMKRGFEALLNDADAISDKPMPDALTAIGMKLVMTVGGASGPLFGTFFMSFGKELNQGTDMESISKAFTKAIDAVAARGKSERGQKTMLDVLYPVAEVMSKGCTLDELAMEANAAAEATVPMLALKGRASFLGERSVGHMDAGSKSCALLIDTVTNWLGQKT